ncbi:T9SS type A sorting domain-containing protein [Rasiella sp. SM2506]|uniref:T9SS type A sorting domain-containing protein n=1 Tax=Rasiella sp. SM2506 TaxID=3423914 RepID=UPI003D7920D4
MKLNTKLFSCLFSFLFALNLNSQNTVNNLANYYTDIDLWNANAAVAVGRNNLITTQNQGDSWSITKVNAPNYSKVISEIEIIDQNSAIAVGDKGLVLYTINQGETWFHIPLIVGNENVVDVQFIDGVGYMVGRYDDENNNVQRFLYSSLDNGLTWQEVPSNIVSLGGFNPLFDLYFTSASVGFLSVNGDIYTTIDGGITWEIDPAISEDINLSKIYFLNESEGYTILWGTNEVHKTLDGGETWTPLTFTDNSANFEITDTKIYYTLYNQSIRSANLDGTNEIVFDIPEYGFITSIDFLNDTIGYISGRKNQALGTGGKFIYKTTNGGVTWQVVDNSGINTGNSNGYNYLNKVSENTFVLSAVAIISGDSKSHVIVSEDNGTSWKVTKTFNTNGGVLYAEDNYISQFHYEDPASASTAIVSQSFDGGETWIDGPILSGTEVSNFYRWQQVSQNDIFYQIATILKHSTDLGQTWTSLTPPPGLSIFKSHFNSITEGYIYGRNNNDQPIIYRTTDGGVTWVELFTLTSEIYDFEDSFDFSDPERIIVAPRFPGNTIYQYNVSTNIFSNIELVDEVVMLTNVNSTSFLMKTTTGYVKLTQDNGQNFITLKNTAGGTNTNNPPIYIVDDETFIFYDFEFLNCVELYTPEIPDFLSGPFLTDLGTTTGYIVPPNTAATLEWSLLSGGNLVLNPATESYRANVQWTEPGTHTLRARYINEFGSSSYKELQVVVNNIIDNDPPNIITQDITVELNENGIATITTTDIDNGTTDNFTPTNLIEFELSTYSFNCSTIGDNDVIFTATDLSNNSASVTVTVTVVDYLAPEINTQNITIDLEGENTITIIPEDVNSGSEDNCGIVSLDLDIDTFSDPGIYTVNLTGVDNENNSASKIATVTVVDSVLGIKEQASLSLSIIPNPTNGLFQVVTSSNYERILIYDIFGRIVFNEDFETQINISTFKDGIYFVQLIDIEKKSHVHKLIKK